MPLRSERLIKDLKSSQLLSANANIQTLQLILRQYLLESFQEGVLNEKIAANKPIYNQPIYRDI